MNMQADSTIPLVVQKGEKREIRSQFGALCYRMNKGKPEVLLITSRTRKRWIIPKGWPTNGKSPAQAAAQEAWEEAGVTGVTSEVCLGHYSYVKQMSRSEDLSCLVAVFPLKVKKLAKAFPERNERDRQWISPKKAAKLVAEPELRAILRRFDPRIFN